MPVKMGHHHRVKSWYRTSIPFCQNIHLPSDPRCLELGLESHMLSEVHCVQGCYVPSWVTKFTIPYAAAPKGKGNKPED